MSDIYSTFEHQRHLFALCEYGFINVKRYKTLLAILTPEPYDEQITDYTFQDAKRLAYYYANSCHHPFYSLWRYIKAGGAHRYWGLSNAKKLAKHSQQKAEALWFWKHQSTWQALGFYGHIEQHSLQKLLDQLADTLSKETVEIPHPFAEDFWPSLSIERATKAHLELLKCLDCSHFNGIICPILTETQNPLEFIAQQQAMLKQLLQRQYFRNKKLFNDWIYYGLISKEQLTKVVLESGLTASTLHLYAQPHHQSVLNPYFPAISFERAKSLFNQWRHSPFLKAFSAAWRDVSESFRLKHDWIDRARVSNEMVNGFGQVAHVMYYRSLSGTIDLVSQQLFADIWENRAALIESVGILFKHDGFVQHLIREAGRLYYYQHQDELLTLEGEQQSFSDVDLKLHRDLCAFESLLQKRFVLKQIDGAEATIDSAETKRKINYVTALQIVLKIAQHNEQILQLLQGCSTRYDRQQFGFEDRAVGHPCYLTQSHLQEYQAELNHAFQAHLANHDKVVCREPEKVMNPVPDQCQAHQLVPHVKKRQ